MTQRVFLITGCGSGIGRAPARALSERGHFVYATDVDAALQNFDLMGQRFGAHRTAPPMTLLGVTRLALPGLLFEIEATATA